MYGRQRCPFSEFPLSMDNDVQDSNRPPVVDTGRLYCAPLIDSTRDRSNLPGWETHKEREIAYALRMLKRIESDIEMIQYEQWLEEKTKAEEVRFKKYAKMNQRFVTLYFINYGLEDEKKAYEGWLKRDRTETSIAPGMSKERFYF